MSAEAAAVLDPDPQPIVEMCRYCGLREVCGDPQGPYRWCCGSCKAAKIEKRRTTATGAAIAIDDATFEGKAKALVSAGRQLDKALDQTKKTKLSHNEALRILSDAAGVWRTTCERLATVAEGRTR